MPTLILVRHGVSTWNLENRFTGWMDAPLAPQGIVEAEEARRRIREMGVEFSVAFSSLLSRAHQTLDVILRGYERPIPIRCFKDLNERHYGDLQGLVKSDMVTKYGAEQVHRWRRSYTERPPGGESLADTAVRVLHCWQQEIAPELRAGHSVLVVAHGNTIRALIMHLDAIAPEDIPALEIPFGVPIVYELDDALHVRSRST